MPDLFDLPFESDDGDPPPRPRREVLTVSALTAAIREHLEEAFFEVWVEGEVSNHRPWNGLIYFTLKDAGAQLRVIMFRTAVRRLKFALEDGMHVLARGRVSVYDQRGEYQLVCEHVEPRGLGALQLAVEQLKTRLTAEGLFDSARKRPLPVLPRKIGIVTSLEGAALHDIIRVISRRHARVHLVIRPSRVQGDGAADDLARGLAAVAGVPGVDVIIIGRGGGSIEDLWAFNEEVLARAIAAAPVPVVSAVGHEVDWTIADGVADVRAATPSQAAELVIAPADEFRMRIERGRERLRATLASGDRDPSHTGPGPREPPGSRRRPAPRRGPRPARGRSVDDNRAVRPASDAAAAPRPRAPGTAAHQLRPAEAARRPAHALGPGAESAARRDPAAHRRCPCRLWHARRATRHVEPARRARARLCPVLVR